MIKKFKTFFDEKEIHNICKEHSIKKYYINKDGTIDVSGNVKISSSKIPLRFNRVSGNFNCSYNNLTSLNGSPTEVGGNFNCEHNNLINLSGGPKTINGDFICCNNRLETLYESPVYVGGNYFCYINNLTTLKDAPKEVGGLFYCSNNPLPDLINQNIKYVNDIIKYQDDYSIWNNDSTLNEYRFKDMMVEVIAEYNKY